MRWPSGDQWTPHPAAAFSIAAGRVSDETPWRTQQSQVTVALALLDRQATQWAFHVDLLAHHIQPLTLRLSNDSPHEYQFRTADVGAHVIPAKTAARFASVHPLILVTRWVKWVAFFVPGFLFDAVIEPASTIDFPGMREASQWPDAVVSPQAIQAEFVRQEIADGTVAPQGTLEGILFVRPLPLGQPLSVSLRNATTGELLRLEVPLPPAVYRASHAYVQPSAAVWNASVQSAKAIAGWDVVSADAEVRLITVRKGSGWLWGRHTPMTIALTGAPGAPTTVALESAMGRATSERQGEHSRTIDDFFDRLDRLFPQPPPPSSTTASSTTAPVSTSGSLPDTDAQAGESSSQPPTHRGEPHGL